MDFMFSQQLRFTSIWRYVKTHRAVIITKRNKIKNRYNLVIVYPHLTLIIDLIIMPKVFLAINSIMKKSIIDQQVIPAIDIINMPKSNFSRIPSFLTYSLNLSTLMETTSFRRRTTQNSTKPLSILEIKTKLTFSR